MRLKWCVPLVALALIVGACATKAIPEGYDVGHEVRLVEISGYLDSLRASYESAWQNRVITMDQYIMAFKADTQLTRVWNEYVELVRTEKDTPEKFRQIVVLIDTFELTILEVGLELAGNKPASIGGR